MLKLISALCLVLLAGIVSADTPANCTYEEVRGVWIFHEGPRGNTKDINCSADFNLTSAFTVQLDFPNIATDENGNVGTWTMIYNQGFEVTINNRKYFAFSLYVANSLTVTSYCNHTLFGWAHATGVNPTDWSCYIGNKIGGSNKPKTSFSKVRQLLDSKVEKQLYQKNVDFVNEINSKQSSWKATHYDWMEKMTISDLVKMSGGKKSRVASKPRAAPIDEKIALLAASLPTNVDWRNVSGVNYVSPIRNQLSCGSCYAFASMAMNEARLRIKTLNRQQTIFSPQNIVECSEYSQGCDGGFPYLIGGKYAEDFGLVEESCTPYKGQDGKCSTSKSCTRTYSTNYRYIGGFFGACNEAVMRIELAKNGPFVIGFEVTDDFMSYKGGIYHQTTVKDTKNFRFNPFEETNHAVLVVGYGVEEKTSEPYWIVKNSWGTGWGENGYFRIRRGTDELAFESLAVAADIVV